MENQQVEVVNEISCLGVTLESSGGWNKYKASRRIEGNPSFVAVDRCLTV